MYNKVNLQKYLDTSYRVYEATYELERRLYDALKKFIGKKVLRKDGSFTKAVSEALTQEATEINRAYDVSAVVLQPAVIGGGFTRFLIEVRASYPVSDSGVHAYCDRRHFINMSLDPENPSVLMSVSQPSMLQLPEKIDADQVADQVIDLGERLLAFGQECVQRDDAMKQGLPDFVKERLPKVKMSIPTNFKYGF